MRNCSITGCKRKIRYKSPKDLCYLHYKRWWRKNNFDTNWYKPNITKNGYLRININGKRILQHRYIMEQYLKRPLGPDEKIHHKNHIKTDNRIKNLEIIGQGNHIKIYHPKHPYVDWSKIIVPKKNKGIGQCIVCKKKSRTRGLCKNHYQSFYHNYLKK